MLSFGSDTKRNTGEPGGWWTIDAIGTLLWLGSNPTGSIIKYKEVEYETQKRSVVW